MKSFNVLSNKIKEIALKVTRVEKIIMTITSTKNNKFGENSSFRGIGE